VVTIAIAVTVKNYFLVHYLFVSSTVQYIQLTSMSAFDCMQKFCLIVNEFQTVFSHKAALPYADSNLEICI